MTTNPNKPALSRPRMQPMKSRLLWREPQAQIMAISHLVRSSFFCCLPQLAQPLDQHSQAWRAFFAHRRCLTRIGASRPRKSLVNPCNNLMPFQEDLEFPKNQVFPIPKDTLIVLRLAMPEKPTEPTHNKGVLVKLIEPIASRDQHMVKIVAKSRKGDHALKSFSLTFDTNAMGATCPLVCYCKWLVPLDEWCLMADAKNMIYGIPPSGNAKPFGLWWGDVVETKSGAEKQRWIRVGDTYAYDLPSEDYVRDYDQIHLMVAGIVPADEEAYGEGESLIAWDEPNSKYQVWNG